MIKVACADFPVGRKTYESKLRTVELDQLFDKTPRPETILKWKNEAPDQFDFIVCASKLITHAPTARAHSTRTRSLSTGSFADSAIVRQAYTNTLQIAEVLRARLVFFKLPSTFAPNADNIQRLQRFFSQKRGHILFVWEPPISWPLNLIDELSETYRIMPVMNPLGKLKPTPNSPMRYYRLGGNGKTSGTGTISYEEMKKVKSLCDTPLCYVVFNNGPTAFEDAVKFSLL